MASRWVHVLVKSTRYSPDYIYDKEMTGFEQKLWLAFRLGILNFKRRYARRFNNSECIWEQCQHDDTLAHCLTCPYYDLKPPNSLENMREMIPYLVRLSKVREEIMGEPLYFL